MLTRIRDKVNSRTNPSYFFQKGYSTLELLVVVFISLVLFSGLFSLYYNLFKTEKESRIALKTELDLQSLQTQLHKIFTAIGFGIPLNFFNTHSRHCTENYVLSKNETHLCFLSVALRQAEYSGCWWICEGNNSLSSKVNSKTWLGGNCELNYNHLFLRMNSQKSNYQILRNVHPCNNANNGDIVFFLHKSRMNFPSDFWIRLGLSVTNVTHCAPGTKDLELRIGSDPPQPLISCVGDFRVRFITKEGNLVDSIPSLDSLHAIRYCLLIQISPRLQAPEQLPYYSERCGDVFFDNPMWKYYRWRVLEEEIVLYNLVGSLY